VTFTSPGEIEGKAQVYLRATGTHTSADDYDEIMLVQFRGSDTSLSPESNSRSSSGCDAGFGYAAAGLLAILMIARKRSK